MPDFNQELEGRLEELGRLALKRELRRIDSPQSTRLQIAGKSLLNFSSNDYLGLANDPRLKEAAIQGIQRFGAGAGASRLICGSLAPHHELEQTLAAYKGTEAALVFASGYAAALGTIGALLNKADVLIIDKRVHASIIDAARLCGAQLRVYGHGDLNQLEALLAWANHRRAAGSAPAVAGRTLIVTETVFSMDGDQAPLRDIVELKDRYGAWLMIDEAHATGLYGPNRRGLAEAEIVADRIEIQLGTLGKAIGASGGYICGSRALIDYLINRARSFIFTTAPVPAAAAAATAGIELIQSGTGRSLCHQLWARVEQFSKAVGLPSCRSAIVPLVIGDERRALELAESLRVEGIYAPAIRYPTVARKQARLRLTFSASHSEADVRTLIRELTRAGLFKFSCAECQPRYESAPTDRSETACPDPNLP